MDGGRRVAELGDPRGFVGSFHPALAWRSLSAPSAEGSGMPRRLLLPDAVPSFTWPCSEVPGGDEGLFGPDHSLGIVRVRRSLLTVVVLDGLRSVQRGAALNCDEDTAPWKRAASLGPRRRSPSP